MSSEELTFAARYAAMEQPELLHTARSYDSLVEPAQAALRAEFARRNLPAPLADDTADVPLTLVTIQRYRDLSEAIVARSLLQSAGIEVFLQDENLVRLDWQVSNFIGGIRLQVDAADQLAATELLSQPVPDPIPFADGQPGFSQPHCPVCNSVDITFEGASRGAAITALYLVGVPIPGGPKTWRCNACEARWEDIPDQLIQEP